MPLNIRYSQNKRWGDMVNYSGMVELVESQKSHKTIESMAKSGIDVTNASESQSHFWDQWSRGEEEFVKRAWFVLMATVSIHDKNTGDIEFIKFLPLIKNNSTDNRNLVKKAVNWALRQIGKRNLHIE